MTLDSIRTVHPLSGAVRTVTRELLAEAYLCPTPAAFDPMPLIAAAKSAPWAKSHGVAPAPTGLAVAKALDDLIGATVALDPVAVEAERLPTGRARRHLEALRDLWRDHGGLPETLAPLAHAASCGAGDALEPLPVVEVTPRMGARAVDDALARLLRDHHGSVVAEDAPGAAPAASCPRLRALQADVLSGRALEDPPEIACHGLRDPLAEAAFAAARAQAMLDEGVVGDPGEIGLLVPERPDWTDELEAIFERAGLRLSGAPCAPGARDVDGEAAHLLLTVLRHPAPGMATRALAVLPCLVGAARREEAQRLILRGTPRDAAELRRRLSALAKLLPAGPAGRVGALIATLPAEGGLDWDALLEATAPRPPAMAMGERRLGAVTVLPEGQVPWRTVRRLIVMGAAGDRYPVTPPASALFADHELDLVRERCGLALPTRAGMLATLLERFRRQLSAARDGIEVLVPRRDRAGARLPASAAISLLARALGREEETLVRDVGSDPSAWPCASRRVHPVAGGGAPAPVPASLDLGGDLRTLRVDDEGRPKPQSPSRLETLMASPLLWILRELGAEDRSWIPDEVGVMEKGTILHAALERLFPPGALPNAALIEAAVPDALAEAIAATAPFMAGPAWAVEREEMAASLRHAASEWARQLEAAAVELLGTEMTLIGRALGLELRGQADAVLRLRDGTILVMDYKSGKSAEREKRLRAGMDVQTSLYAAMLEGARPRGVPDGPVTTGYFCLGDGVGLVWGGAAPFRGVKGDVSEHAFALLEGHLGALAEGRVPIVTQEDLKALEKKGVSTYALDDQIVAAFTPGTR